MSKGKRYRSLRRECFVYYKGGKKIQFSQFRFPNPNGPPCTDPEIIAALDEKVAAGRGIKEDIDAEEILIKPGVVPVDCEKAHIQNAAKRLMELGINVNPALLESGEKTPEVPQLPAKGTVSSSRKEELQVMIDKFGWDIDKDQKVPDLKKAILAKIEESE